MPVITPLSNLNECMSRLIHGINYDNTQKSRGNYAVAKFDLTAPTPAKSATMVNRVFTSLGPSRSTATLNNQDAEQQDIDATVADQKTTKCLAAMPNEIIRQIFACKAAGLDLVWDEKIPSLLVALRGTRLHEVALNAYRENNVVVSAANVDNFDEWSENQVLNLLTAKFIIPERAGWVMGFETKLDRTFNELMTKGQGSKLEPFLYGHAILASNNLETLIFDLTQVEDPFENSYALVKEILRVTAQLKKLVVKARTFQREAIKAWGWRYNGCIFSLFNSMFSVEGRLIKSTGRTSFKQEWSVEKEHDKEFIKLGSRHKTDEDYRKDFEVWVWGNDEENLNGNFGHSTCAHLA